MARFLLDGGRQRLAVVIAVMATTANSCGVGNFNNGTRDLSYEERERERDERRKKYSSDRNVCCCQCRNNH